jgi:hypothetical protein
MDLSRGLGDVYKRQFLLRFFVAVKQSLDHATWGCNSLFSYVAFFYEWGGNRSASDLCNIKSGAVGILTCNTCSLLPMAQKCWGFRRCNTMQHAATFNWCCICNATCNTRGWCTPKGVPTPCCVLHELRVAGFSGISE